MIRVPHLRSPGKPPKPAKMKALTPKVGAGTHHTLPRTHLRRMHSAGPGHTAFGPPNAKMAFNDPEGLAAPQAAFGPSMSAPPAAAAAPGGAGGGSPPEPGE